MIERAAHRSTMAVMATLSTLALSVILFFTDASAQTCSPGMLSIWGDGCYAGTADRPALRLQNGFTIECWAKPDAANLQGALIEKGSSTSACYGLYVESGRIVGRIKQASALSLSQVIPSPDAWHHFALVFRPGDSLYLYIDGLLVNSKSVTGASLPATVDSVRVGMSASRATFHGSIDDARLWSTPHSAATITSLMSHALDGTESGLVAYYALDDEVGSTVAHDFSTHGATAGLSGSSIAIVTSSSPITTPTPGYRLDAIEKFVDLGTRRCVPSFDTVIHVRNLSGHSLLVNSVAPFRGQAFSVTSDLPFTLEADSTKYFAIKVHFSPSTGGVYDDSLYISSAENCGGVLRIGLHAIYDSVGVSVTPSLASIGSRLKCEFPVVRAITLENTSTTDSVSIVSTTLPAGLSILSTLPIRLAHGERRSVLVRIDSGARGAFDLRTSLALDKCSREASLDIRGTRSLASFGLPASINFGTFAASPNGVTLDTIVVVQNVGDTGMQITSISSSNPSLRITQSRASEFLQPGDTLQIRVEVHATECGLTESFLHVRGFYCGVDTAVSIRVNLRSPQQLLSRAVQAGVTCNFVDTTLWIANPNSITMRVDTMTFDQDAIFFVRPYTFPFTIAPFDSARIDIRFNPGFNGKYSVNGSIWATPCSVTPVRLSGSKGINDVTYSSPRLNFGRGCDLTATRQYDTLINASGHAVTIVDTVYSGSKKFMVDLLTLPVTIPVGGRLVVSVRYAPQLGRLDTGSFVLIAAEGCAAAQLALRGSREHPLVALNEQSIYFDTICSPTSSFAYLHILNAGVDTADVGAIVVPSGYTVVSAPLKIAAGRIDSALIRFTPTLPQEYTGRVAVPIGLCGDTLFATITGSGGPLPALVASIDTLRFDHVRLGDSLVQCATLANASCVPIVIQSKDYETASGVFRINSGADADTVSRGRSTFVCVTFTPKARESYSDVLRVKSDSTDIPLFALIGDGVAPWLTYSEASLDFGFVLHGDRKTLGVKMTNVGNSTAHLSYTTSDGVFRVAGPDSLLAGASDSIYVTFSPIASTDAVSAMALVRYDDFTDTLSLMGHGSERGLQFSSSEAAFGAVHVHADSVRRITVTAVEDFPTIIDSAIIADANPAFVAEWSAKFPDTLKDERDAAFLTLHYSPNLETVDTAHLRVYTKKSVATFLLRGSGVSEHISLNATAIDVGDVELGSSKTVPRIIISDTGGYALTIASASASNFIVSPDITGSEIAPGASQSIDVTFTPTRARLVRDTLKILSSAPEGTQYVLLSGRGVYPVASRPRFSYSIGSASIRSGETASLPISIDGSFLNHIDVDSTVITIRFDPQMARVRAVESSMLRQWRLNADSEVTIVFNGGPDHTQVLGTLTLEALLGPHPTSDLSVVGADPRSDLAPLSADGTLTVTDCDGFLHGVGFAGEYALQQSSPNPASANTVLSYDLGMRGTVAIEIFSTSGQLIKRIDAGEQTAGHHSLTLPLSEMPAGRYTYRLKSLEYTGEGTFLVVH